MRYGSLFTGIGGLDLAVEHVLGATCAWQAERESYRRRVLERHWPGVQRFADVGDIGAGAAPVDLVCGGFVCTEISNAGTRRGMSGTVSGPLWREYARILRDLRPHFAFVENVAALTGRGLDEVLADLAALGFDAEWTTLRASDAGAPHDRDRIWILAYSDRDGFTGARRTAVTTTGRARNTGRAGRHRRSRRSCATGQRHTPEGSDAWEPEPEPSNRELADADAHGRGGRGESDHGGRGMGSDAPGTHDARSRARALIDRPDWPPDRAAGADEWDAWLTRCPGRQPGVRRGTYGSPRGLDARRRRARLAALGDAVCPQQAALALRILIDRATDERTDP